MHPLVKLAPALALVAAIGAPARPNRTPTTALPTGPAAVDVKQPSPTSRCRERALWLSHDQRTQCLQLPARGGPEPPTARQRRLRQEGPLSQATAPARPELGLGSDIIARLPERPEDYLDYQLPLEPVADITSGPYQAEASAPMPTGPIAETAAIRIPGAAGAAIQLVDLEGQQKRPEVLLVGSLYGVTVAVRHQLEIDGRPREIIAIYGNLARPGPGIVNAAQLGPLAVIGFLEDAQGASLHFELRQQHAGRPPSRQYLSPLLGHSTPVDVRNLLPLTP